jgi:hexosaminidase
VQNDTSYITPNQSATADISSNFGGAGGSWCAPYKTWQRIYSFDMTYNIPSNPGDGKVLGGEAALWSEQSDDSSLDVKLWPRSSAAAEIFWSGSYDKEGNRRTLDDIWPRINDWRYRLVDRGINASKLSPPRATDSLLFNTN